MESGHTVNKKRAKERGRSHSLTLTTLSLGEVAGVTMKGEEEKRRLQSSRSSSSSSMDVSSSGLRALKVTKLPTSRSGPAGTTSSKTLLQVINKAKERMKGTSS